MHIIAYDIKEDKIRNKVSKLLKDYGERVQYSLFESETDKANIEKLEKIFKKIISLDKDSIKIYFLCKDCADKVKSIGVQKTENNFDVFVF
ncbi:MAG: CRISPR-associated endonuclease Cas2 [Bacteroidetes bacterium]|nr:MAG: CRISPR-associated endonuclease Cas2 [Bacteroidota bacterium]